MADPEVPKEEEPIDYVKEVFGWIGFCLAWFFFISPITMFIGLIKERITYKQTPGAIFICNLLQTVLWTAYGLRLDELQMYLCNGVGA
ncbi:MAG: SemiSWEET family transporter, partial [Mycoplasma sp.]